jgi:hypothetical protein
LHRYAKRRAQSGSSDPSRRDLLLFIQSEITPDPQFPSKLVTTKGTRSGLNALAFGDGENAVDAGDLNLLYDSAGPVDFKFVDVSGRAQAEVQARIRAGGIAAAAEDVSTLAGASGGEDRCLCDGDRQP